MKTSQLLGLLGLIGLLAFSPAHAGSISLPLYKLSGAKNVNLRCVGASYALTLPTPKRWRIRKVTLRFSYVNSAALIKANSRLTLLLNGSPISQLTLDPLAPESSVKIDLPPEQLNSGYNLLEFSASQHYTMGCESPCAPELWTQLKLGEAMLDLEYDWLPIPLRVSAVADLLFDPLIIPKGQVHIVTESVSNATMTGAAVVTSGVALRFDYRSIDFSISNQLQAGRDNILLGEKPYVEEFLRQHGIDQEVTGPVVKIFHLPAIAADPAKPGSHDAAEDTTHALLVISGNDADQLKLASQSFDVLSNALPDSQEMVISEFSMPEIAQYSGKDTLVPGEKYPFSKLGFRDSTLAGLSPQEIGFSFRLPSDFSIAQNQHVELDIDFAYGAGMRPDSTINIALNGNFVNAILLESIHGGQVSGYKLSLPTYLFHPGTNKLTFNSALSPSQSEQCTFMQTQNLMATIYATSTMLFPEMPHRIEMPRLDLFFVNAFPYTRWPDGYETTLILSQPDFGSAAVMMNLVALMSQKNGYPLFGLNASVDAEAPSNDELILIGRTDTLPKVFQERTPIVLTPLNRIPYSVFHSTDEASTLAFSTQKSDIGQQKGLIMQMQSPYKEGRTVTVIASPSYDGLKRLGASLWEGNLQSGARGDLIVVDYLYDEKRQQRYNDGWEVKVDAMDTGKHFVTGKGGKISPVDFYLSSFSWIYIAALVTVTMLLSLAVYVLLKRYRARRLGDDKA